MSSEDGISITYNNLWAGMYIWTVSMNAVETVLDLKGWESAQKCAYLVSLSTITMMTLGMILRMEIYFKM